jgi:hypothetical protein
MVGEAQQPEIEMRDDGPPVISLDRYRRERQLERQPPPVASFGLPRFWVCVYWVPIWRIA